MKRNLLATAISGLLALSSTPIFAQDAPAAAPTDDEKKKAAELTRVVVTGSLIPVAAQETASPVTTITAEDIQKQGYKNVADVLRAQPLATGAVQDNQFSVGFTPGATTVSLLGLSPSFTLILIDGRPLADYPLLYNGQSNFTDLSTIPTAMIERIDILPGNQSAIYGSSAIAGVVNIVLKKHIEGNQLSLRLGGYDDGGGDNLRFQWTGGWSSGDFDLTYGFQYSKQDPIWGYDRNWYDSTNDNPDPTLRFGSRTFLILDGFTNTYIDPGQANCDNVAGNFGGTTDYEFRAGRGFYCGSRAEPGYTTFIYAFVLATALFIANTINVGADLAGMADAAEMLSGVSSHVWVVVLGAGIAMAAIRLRYTVLAHTLKWLAFVLIAYAITAFYIG
ncbi:MAG: TonB-dependent receptor plug domain-containing protein, partial [Arenimonas sp.]